MTFLVDTGTQVPDVRTVDAVPAVIGAASKLEHGRSGLAALGYRHVNAPTNRPTIPPDKTAVPTTFVP